MGAPWSNAVAGAAHVFLLRNDGVFAGTELFPTDSTPNLRFGRSVAIAGDGCAAMGGECTAVVGDPWFHHSAYVFDRVADNVWGVDNNSNGSADETQKFPSPRADLDLLSGFGQSVAMSESTVIVGAPFHDFDASAGPYVDRGTAFVFTPDAITGIDAMCVVGNFVPKSNAIVALSTDDVGITSIAQALLNAGAASVSLYSRADIAARRPIADGANVLVIQLVATSGPVTQGYIDGVRDLIQSGASVIASYDGAAMLFDEFAPDIVNPPIPSFNPAIALFSGAVHGGGVLIPSPPAADMHFVDPAHRLALVMGATYEQGPRLAFSIDNFNTQWLHTVATFTSQGFGGLNPAGTFPAILAGRCGAGRVALHNYSRPANPLTKNPSPMAPAALQEFHSSGWSPYRRSA